ncbi:MAG: NADH-quinone oxidoreductase subunit C [Verrucomicrobiota bacterium]
MNSLESIQSRIQAAVPGARVEIVPNDSPSGQRSLLLDPEHALAVATFLRDDAELRLDYASNVTGIDWPDAEISRKVMVRKTVDGVEKDVEEIQKTRRPGFLEVVYHLYSTRTGAGPVILRLRTVNRSDQVHLPSFTPVWRSCEFQEREVYDLYGIVFDGHPDLRRILMWKTFKDHPMRKDYVAPDDFEYEPTPHDKVLERAKAHAAQEAKS